MSDPATPTGSLDQALAHAARLLETRPDLACEQAAEILKTVPESPHARLILGQAQLRCGRVADALAILEALAREQPRSAATQFELGCALGAAGRLADAIAALEAATHLKPDWPEAWRTLADHLDAANDEAGADKARAAFLTCAVRDPGLRAAAHALRANELDHAEALLRSHLKLHETDIAALRMLAEIATRLRRFYDAQLILERCLELAPSFLPAMHQYAVVLFRQSKAAQAMPQIERLLESDAGNVNYLALRGAVRAHLGDTDDSIDDYQAVLRRFPGNAKIWLSLGHAFKTAGRSEDCVGAYRQAIRMLPNLGDAWWSLANLKTYRFDAPDIAAMRSELAKAALADEDRLHLEFALGKALEDREDYEASFVHYSRGAQIRRRMHPYDANETSEHVQRTKRLFTEGFLASHAGQGAPDRDPIFILGMPRSGSTLLEQILASHPLVEGTMELPDIPAFARDLAGVRARKKALYPESIDMLSPDEILGMGQKYLADTRIHRKSQAPHFIDKMPNNFLHVGLIHLILPNARIIDSRRHPMACCFSNFKQHFARGQNFSYGLPDVGRFYRDYVELMSHFDRLLPGRVCRVIYEAVIEDPEAQVRRVLDYCGLPFDERCLRFYENDRAVRTASAEQVRQPIFRSGLDQWRHFEPWLGPLEDALGSVLERYPDVPEFPAAAPAAGAGG